MEKNKDSETGLFYIRFYTYKAKNVLFKDVFILFVTNNLRIKCFPSFFISQESTTPTLKQYVFFLFFVNNQISFLFLRITI